jgi:hypothetical protein
MTRKHYELIADTVNSLIFDGTLDPIAACRVAGALGDSLELNQNFDRQRFVEQCLLDLDKVGTRMQMEMSR